MNMDKIAHEPEELATTMTNRKPTPMAQADLSQQIVHQTNEVMKSSVTNRIVSTLAVCVILGAAIQGYSQTTVQVDSTKPWVGYMNWYVNNGGTQGAFVTGSGWGTAALTAYFNGTNNVTIIPNTNCWNARDPYWVNTNTVPYSGAKWMEANFYADVGTAFAGQTVTFVGDVLTNSLVDPYVSQAFIKEFAPGYTYVGMTTAPLVAGSPFTVVRSINPGNIAQYGFITTGPDADPATIASLGKAVVAVNNADPSLATLTSEALVEGQAAKFTIAAQGTAPLSYQWAFITATTSNILSNGGRISGAATNSLTITNVALADAGTYTVTVTNSHGLASESALLTVVPVAQAATNLLIDPDFESGSFAASGDAGWFNYSGAAQANTNGYYYLSATPVTVVNGSNCVQVFASGAYNGVYQDRPALPGQVYTGNCWFLTPLEDPIAGANVCYLEVQFRNAADAALIQYSTAMVDTNFPTSAWISLQPINVRSGDFTTSLGTSPYMVAPAGTTKVRFQITYHAAGGSGSVYVDAANLMLKEPVVTATLSGNNMQITFPTLYGPSYQVYYRTNLTDTIWQALGRPVVGDGNVKSVSDPIGPTRRFYVVNTL